MKFNVISCDINGEKIELPSIDCRTFEDAQKMHHQLSLDHPDSFINFVEGPKNFIMGQAKNMQIDESRLDKGLISWNDYLNKWYPQKVAELMY
jgi:hypothetical protein